MTLSERLANELGRALVLVVGNAAVAELGGGLAIEVTVAADLRYGDYQSNLAMVLAKRLRQNPRELAAALSEQVAELLSANDGGEPLAVVSVAGPGFINFKISGRAFAERLREQLVDERLGVANVGSPRRVVIDFSAPNVAKPMHVGHIRSTIIGDSLGRIGRFLGHSVVTDNHIGDWGTQFGMVIYGWKNDLNEEALEAAPLSELLRLYRGVNKLCKESDEVKEACRAELVKLQRGDEENLRIWRRCVEVSRQGLVRIYRRLDVEFDHWLGESFYHDRLLGLVEELLKRGVVRESDGAICAFSDEALEPKHDPFKEKREGEWADLPMIVRKRDGGFNYATTDLATIEYRLKEWGAEELLYVVDARQSLHFRQLFDVARQLGWQANFQHVSFGTILGKDGKPLKTRDGDLPQLEDVLNDAVSAAERVIGEKNPELEQSGRAELAEIIGIAAIKFTELSHHRSSDYVFDLEKMVALQGDTAPYLQYSYVRVQSIFRKIGGGEPDLGTQRISLSEDGELRLARELSRYGEILPAAFDGYRPNLVTQYLLDLARAFHSFFESCPVLKSEGEVRTSRLALCAATGRVLKHGLGLLGIEVPERM